MRNFVLVSLRLVLFCLMLTACKPSQLIAPSDPAMSYLGRFDSSMVNTYRFDWPGTEIRFSLEGKKAEVLLEGGSTNYFNLFVNNRVTEVVHLPKGKSLHLHFEDEGPHHIRIQKRTEAEQGIAVFMGIALPAGNRILPYPFVKKKQIEFIGNSITCGYGTEGRNRSERFSPATENVNQSYASIIARAFDADASLIAHSGLGVVRNYGDPEKVATSRDPMPKRWERVLDSEETLIWNFQQQTPQMMVINLGTNDYSTDPHPDTAVFQQGYVQLIHDVRSRYGTIPVFLIAGPLRGEPVVSIIREVIHLVRQDNPEDPLYFLEIPQTLLDPERDLGSDSHPNYHGQLKMAAHILPEISRIMDWEYETNEMNTLPTTEK